MSREMTKQMTMAVPHGLEVTGLGVREKYGMGFTFNRFHDRTIRGHGGGGPFFRNRRTFGHRLGNRLGLFDPRQL